MKVSQDEFIELYRRNRLLLEVALTTHRPSDARLDAAATAVATIGNALDFGAPLTPGAVADYTGRLFSCIAQLSENPRIVECVETINGRLRHLRTLEYECLDDVPGELMNICEQFLADRLDETANAIAHYHSRRLGVLSELLAASAK